VHRLPTIHNADKITVVDKGKNVEEGTHDELLDKGPEGRYYNLNNQHSQTLARTSSLLLWAYIYILTM